MTYVLHRYGKNWTVARKLGNLRLPLNLEHGWMPWEKARDLAAKLNKETV